MSADTPSALLSRAADLIRDTAAAATPGPWGSTTDANADVTFFGRNDPETGQALTTIAGLYHGEHAATGRWIALMSPAVAPMIEKWLRDTAAYFDEFADYWVTIPEQARDALALASAVLGEKEETDG